MRDDSIMKLDQKSKVKSQKSKVKSQKPNQAAGGGGSGGGGGEASGSEDAKQGIRDSLSFCSCF